MNSKAIPPQHFILLILIAVVVSGCIGVKQETNIRVHAQHDVTAAGDDGLPFFYYNLTPPEDAKLAVDSGGFFHPIATPKGHTVTGLAPEDHPHHRGAFLGLVEVHGVEKGDFWGWGEYAPTNGRRIVSQSVGDVSVGTDEVAFKAHNHWMADDTVVIDEHLTTAFQATDDLYILDLTYTLTPMGNTRVARWGFGGFCLRLRRDGTLTYASPKGAPTHPNPNHMKPETSWPDEPWYAALITLEDGTKVGAAVINHPDNLPCLWHNHPDVFMINPCITAPGDLNWEQGKPITLKYRVVTFDDRIPSDRLNALASPW